MVALRILSIALIALLAGLSASLQAAPQALAIVAPTDAVEFSCGAQGCVVHVPTLCLQSYRDPPDYGAPYEIVAGGASLIVEQSNGVRLELPAAGRVRITANENFSSVSLRLSSAAADEFGARRIEVTIEPGTILLPVAEAGDPNPQDPDEVAVATGPSRDAALRFLASSTTRVAAAQLLSRGITLLPEYGERTDFDGRAVWGSVLADAAASGADPAVLDLARDLTAVCPMAVLRRCLEMRQRDMLRDLNDRLWDQFGGS